MVLGIIYVTIEFCMIIIRIFPARKDLVDQVIEPSCVIIFSKSILLILRRRNSYVTEYRFEHPAHPTPLCECPPDIDIYIGWNEDETKPTQDVLDLVVEYFRNLGYSVGLNAPFSNADLLAGVFYLPSIDFLFNVHEGK